MFGAPMKEHDARYDHLSEWLQVIHKMWNEEEEFDFQGEFYNVVRGASMPKPLQRPRPPIMNAGGSPRGMRFACEHADMAFVILRSDDPEICHKQIDEYKKTAREEFGRNIQVWTYCPVVQRDTRKEAEDYLQYFAVELEDKDSVDAWSKGLATETKIVTSEQMRIRFAAGAGGNILLGTADDIADQLQMFNDAGLDGVLCTWVDFYDGLPRFARDVIPLLERRGLRAPHVS
jgi:alkanesulfonate monooxygenase SsuD/methylene tetrahydromethanopterin reductase-like flavin-dependent oxidoreductase (luciferase family)